MRLAQHPSVGPGGKADDDAGRERRPSVGTALESDGLHTPSEDTFAGQEKLERQHWVAPSLEVFKVRLDGAFSKLI